jgi:hypothetical protein
MDENPYSAPTAPLGEPPRGGEAPPLWNPNAAASWSLLFTPAFGAFLQMRNWQALGDEKNAKVSWIWFIATIVLTLAVIGGSFFLPEGSILDKLSSRFGIIILLAWYFSHGKLQAKTVKEKFGNAYPHRGWGAPLGIAFGVVMLLFVGAFVAVVLATVIQRN